MNRESVDHYLEVGCGRCALGGTPACKVHRWTPILVALRAQLRAAGLTEEMKWGSPCYTAHGKNVVMLTSLVDACALGFFQGVALPDPAGLLEKQGPNMQTARSVFFRHPDEVTARGPAVAALIEAAIAFAASGAKIPRVAAPEPVPDALAALLDADPALRAAFDALTPGRRRSHILHVAGAKQRETQDRRAARCAPEILAGRGFQER